MAKPEEQPIQSNVEKPAKTMAEELADQFDEKLAEIKAAKESGDKEELKLLRDEAKTYLKDATPEEVVALKKRVGKRIADYIPAAKKESSELDNEILTKEEAAELLDSSKEFGDPAKRVFDNLKKIDQLRKAGNVAEADKQVDLLKATIDLRTSLSEENRNAIKRFIDNQIGERDEMKKAQGATFEALVAAAEPVVQEEVESVPAEKEEGVEKINFDQARSDLLSYMNNECGKSCELLTKGYIDKIKDTPVTQRRKLKEDFLHRLEKSPISKGKVDQGEVEDKFDTLVRSLDKAA